MTSTHRVIVGVPADHWDGDDSARVKHRRASITKMVDEHLDRISATTDSLALDTIQYAYVTQLEVAYAELFPKHTKHGALAAGLAETPGPPALKLINTDTKESMYPDWPILLKDFPSELDRLVADYERWQSQTTAVAPDPEDDVAVLHQSNLAPAAARAKGGLVAMFYAPWCHYSKLMLPQYAGARALVAEAEAKGLVEPNHVVLGKVNVDHEGDLRQVYNISTYPTLKVFNSKSQPKAKAGTPGGKRMVHAPAASFEAGSASSVEIASHALSTLSWAKKGRAFAVLGDPSESTTDGVAYDTAAKFSGLASLVDRAFQADNAAAAAAAAATGATGGKDESEPSPAEARRVVTALAVFPDGSGGSSSSVSAAARVAATARVADLVAGGSVFVAACGASQARAVLAQLPGGKEEEGEEEGEGEGGQGLGPSTLAAVEAAGASEGGYLLVVSPGNRGILSHPLLAVMPAEGKPQLEVENGGVNVDEEAAFEALRKWVLPATWPLLSRFDPSASQGERIRSGVVTSLLVLVGDEGDFMFEGFKEAMLATARAHVGAAHFLFADASEPRIAPLLRSARAEVPGSDVNAPPVAVLVSMTNAFRPRKVEGSAISAEGLGALLAEAKDERDRAEEEPEEPLVLKKGPSKKRTKGAEL